MNNIPSRLAYSVYGWFTIGFVFVIVFVFLWRDSYAFPLKLKVIVFMISCILKSPRIGLLEIKRTVRDYQKR